VSVRSGPNLPLHGVPCTVLCPKCGGQLEARLNGYYRTDTYSTDHCVRNGWSWFCPNPCSVIFVRLLDDGELLLLALL